MLGLDNAGKTTIVKRFMDEDISTVSPTLGFSIKTIEYKGWTTAALPRRGRPTDSRSIEGDVGGQRTLRSYWRNYYEKTDALVWVVDATDRLRIDDCRIELAGLLLEERLTGASLLVFANKTDVEGCMTENEIRQGLQLDEIQTHKWNIMRCSALTGFNLDVGLEWVVEDAKSKLWLY
ncbi:MAG: hypothetical protein M1815_001506 [Lichina confinis]|nr:MAG: hypothetical protein M1815_001506 [Lichina confinis]